MRQIISAVSAIILVMGACLPLHAQDNAAVRRIVVNAEGSAALAPDMAVLNLTVTREAATARAALDANSAAMEEVIAAMRRFGIAEKDLQTSGFGITPNYIYPASNSGKSRKLTGYTVRNSLTVRVRAIDQTGEVLDESVSLGVNEGGSVQFTHSDPSAALKEARIAAVHAAREKAQTLAAAAGVSLGPVLELSEQSHNPRPVPVMHAEMSTMGARASAVPIAQGENLYRVNVHMTFGIDD